MTVPTPLRATVLDGTSIVVYIETLLVYAEQHASRAVDQKIACLPWHPAGGAAPFFKKRSINLLTSTTLLYEECPTPRGSLY